MSAEQTIFDRMGVRCALCALWPRLEVMARLNKPIGASKPSGLSAFEVFALGWFFGRYIADDPNLCDEHRNFIETRAHELARSGGIVLLLEAAALPVDLHAGRKPIGS